MQPDNLAAVALRRLIDKTGLDSRASKDTCAVHEAVPIPRVSKATMLARIASLRARAFPSRLGQHLDRHRFCGSSIARLFTSRRDRSRSARRGCFLSPPWVDCMFVPSPQGGLSFSLNHRFRNGRNQLAEIAAEAYVLMGQTAENVAKRYGVERERQEQLALESQQKARAG